MITTPINPPDTISTTPIPRPGTIKTTTIDPPETITTTTIPPPDAIGTTVINPPETIRTTTIANPETITTTTIDPPNTIVTTVIDPPNVITTTTLRQPPVCPPLDTYGESLVDSAISSGDYNVVRQLFADLATSTDTGSGAASASSSTASSGSASSSSSAIYSKSKAVVAAEPLKFAIVSLPEASLPSGFEFIHGFAASAVSIDKNGKWMRPKARTVKIKRTKAADGSVKYSVNGTDPDGEFPYTNLSLTYAPKKETFRGTFRFYATNLNTITKGTPRIAMYTARVSGEFKDGVGMGEATVRIAQNTYTMHVLLWQ